MHESILKGLVDRLKAAIAKGSNAQVKRYKELLKKLSHDPVDVEEVAELEDLAAELPVQMANLDTETAVRRDTRK